MFFEPSLIPTSQKIPFPPPFKKFFRLSIFQFKVDYTIPESSPVIGYPCRCTAKNCKNPEGRTELNVLRIRTHFYQTMMRLKDATKKFGRASI
ncbi:unnamed protein product [Meloidogyne enterolobii]|uniref:Uncharacterized protein n=1 Tax=Meloidogyne enterolobii TaxID=390850 RepID=A0ACB1A505_MELEN